MLPQNNSLRTLSKRKALKSTNLSINNYKNYNLVKRNFLIFVSRSGERVEIHIHYSI